MNIDKFGRIPKTRQGPKGLKGEQGPAGEKGQGFNVTSAGDFDIELRKIINCRNPETLYDVANKMYVDEKILLLVRNINITIQGIEEKIHKLMEEERVKQLKLRIEKKI